MNSSDTPNTLYSGGTVNTTNSISTANTISSSSTVSTTNSGRTASTMKSNCSLNSTNSSSSNGTINSGDTFFNMKNSREPVNNIISQTSIETARKSGVGNDLLFAMKDLFFVGTPKDTLRKKDTIKESGNLLESSKSNKVLQDDLDDDRNDVDKSSNLSENISIRGDSAVHNFQ